MPYTEKSFTDEEKRIIQENVKAIEQRLPSGFGNTVPFQPSITLELSFSFEMTEAVRWYFRNKGWDIPRAVREDAGWILAFRGRFPSVS